MQKGIYFTGEQLLYFVQWLKGVKMILLAFPSWLQRVAIAAATAIISLLQVCNEKAVWNAPGLNKESQLFQQALAAFCFCLIHLIL